MFLKYFYDQKLAQASYMVGCQANGTAVVIDPARDIRPYIRTAEKEGFEIVGAAETHIHADFVSGARELGELGATLYLSDEGDADWKYQYLKEYKHQLVKDGDTFMLGNIKFEVVHTPGHTPEHISFLLTDTAGADEPMGIFTGDFVFVGSIGRPDLLEKAAKIENTAEKGARQMYASVERFKQLPAYLQVWPGHGAGSACGKGLGSVPSTTIGYEKMFSAALNHDSEEAFVDDLLTDQPEPPFYFAMMKKLNKLGPPLLRERPEPQKLTAADFEQVTAEATVIDTRPADVYAVGHVPGTINVPLDGGFTNWVGWFLSYDKPFYLIVDDAQLDEARTDLAGIGLDNLVGYFDSTAVAAYGEQGELQTYKVIDAPDLAEEVLENEVTLVDVRAETEWDEGRLPNAHHIMLGYLNERVKDLPVQDDKPVVVQCRTGGRSAIAASILQANGVRNVINMMGGYNGWVDAGLPVEN